VEVPLWPLVFSTLGVLFLSPFILSLYIREDLATSVVSPESALLRKRHRGATASRPHNAVTNVSPAATGTNASSSQAANVSRNKKHGHNHRSRPEVHVRNEGAMVAVELETCQESWQDYRFPHHGCRVNPHSHRPHCQLQDLRLDVSKVQGHRLGGEPLETVLNQPEDYEQITYLPGAWSVKDSFEVPTLMPQFFYIKDVLQNLAVLDERHLPPQPQKLCDHTWEGTTLFITRYEYANFYHTNSDWWNAFYSQPSPDDRGQRLPLHLIFLDAHPASNLDPVWQTFLGVDQLHWVRQLPAGTHCFESARLIPAGYSAAVVPSWTNLCPTVQLSTPYVQAFLRAHQLVQDQPFIRGRVLVLERVAYRAHARSRVDGPPVRALRNFGAAARELPRDFPAYNWTVQLTSLVNQSMTEQLSAIRQAQFIIANHGAGLTHLLFANDNAHVLELSCPDFTFSDLASWRPTIHHYCLSATLVGNVITEDYWNTQVLPLLEEGMQS
jgi:glycoprotein 2-beta-D-xylosyltransferase